METESEYHESTSVTLEWTLRGLKNLFDSTKGDAKSKVTRSPRFGDGRWQILFYANAGLQKEGGDGYVSLYLSCEPTPAEKEAALSDNGRWVRDGMYKFSFELRNVEKTILYNLKEAVNHSFSYKTANWGWAQFARRESIYYQSPTVKSQDAFVILCTVVSTPVAPTPPPPVVHCSIPRPLLETIGSLLDDPVYSDVQFIIAKRGQDTQAARRIWASKKILSRADYFATMFNSNFSEGAGVGPAICHDTPRSASQSLNTPRSSFSGSIMDEFEDSDDEDDDALAACLSPEGHDVASSIGTEEFSVILADTHIVEPDESEGGIPALSLSGPGTPTESKPPPNTKEQEASLIGGSSKPQPMTVVIKDVAYSTYKAILYYIYTDTIVFAPLSSSFTNSKMKSPPRTPSVVGMQNILASESAAQLPGPKRNFGEPPSTRAEWILEWMQENPNRPAPCSAKAVYRVADKLDMGELKERAAKHIFKSLTVNNIAYEVFSPFAAIFEEIRKVEMEFFLTHWHEIRSSESMTAVWQQIRSGRHPGFEEVWPLIAQSLEFKPSASLQPASSTKTVGAAQPQ